MVIMPSSKEVSGVENQGRKRRRGRKSDANNPESRGGGGASWSRPSATSLLIQLSEEAPKWYQVGRQQNFRDATILSHPNETVVTAGGKKQKYESSINSVPAPQVVSKYRSMADDLYRQELQVFAQKQKSDKDMDWIQTTISRGTLKDRIAAMSVLVGNDPVHKFYTLDGLMQMAGCSVSTESNNNKQQQQANARVTQMAGEALEDLFLHTLLPSNRKLLSMAQRPLYLFEQNSTSLKHQGDGTTQRTLSPRILLLWRFEEMLLEKYTSFIRQYVGGTLRDGMEGPKRVALRMAGRLLAAVPTGETLLLPLIVNKLGDPHKQVASTASHVLLQVIQSHFNMQPVIAREVQQLVHRPHLSGCALYNGITFLNQLQLTNDEEEEEENTEEAIPIHTSDGSSQLLAASLVSTYFRLFDVAIQTSASANPSTPSKKKGSKRKQQQREQPIQMKSRLLSALLTGVNRAQPYLPKGNDDIMECHIDALYRVVFKAPAGACTQALLLLFHWAVGSRLEASGEATRRSRAGDEQKMTDKERSRKERFYQTLYSRLSSVSAASVLLGSSTSGGGGRKHLTMFFNLLFKAIKYDTNTTRVITFCKRILCTTIHGPPNVIAASLFLLSEVSKTHPAIRACFHDVLNSSSSHQNDAGLRILDYKKHDPRQALVQYTPASRDGPGAAETDTDTSGIQQGKEDVTLAPSWELSLALMHYHPSVASFARQLANPVNGGEISYDGDPLRDFCLSPFLDKFAYRNPKKVAGQDDQRSQPKSVADRRRHQLDSLQSLPLNDPSFLQRRDVDACDQFFHRFFVERARRDEIKGIVRYSGERNKDTEVNVDLDDDDEEAAEIDALDAAEAKDMDRYHESFEDYERMWDTDEEEEAFVDSLAEKIIEDSIHVDEPGLGELDAEDPDMDGWDDLLDDDRSGDGTEGSADEREAGISGGYSDDEEEKEAKMARNYEDDFFGADDADVGEDRYLDDDDAFMDDNDSSSDDDSEDGVQVSTKQKGDKRFGDHSSDDEDDSAFVRDEVTSSDEDEKEEVEAQRAAHGKRHCKQDGTKREKKNDESVYASLEDYEERINKSWMETQKQSKYQHNTRGSETIRKERQTKTKRKRQRR